MTCEDCEQVLMDRRNGAGTRGWMPGVSIFNLAKEHAQSCSACAAKMSEISHLDDALHQLQISTIGMEAPGNIESILLATFRERTRPQDPAIRRFVSWRMAWVPVAALLIVAAVMAFYPGSSLRKPSAHKIGTEAGGHIEAESPMQQSPTVASGSVGTANRSERVGNRSNGEPVAAGSVGVIAKVNPLKRTNRTHGPPIAVGDDLALNGGGSILRVTLPLSSLVAMGVPVRPEASDPRVTADVTLDPFGTVVGIRLVEANTKTN
jgi:hypothetical protein